MAPYFLLNFYGISSAFRFMNVLAWLRRRRSPVRAVAGCWQSQVGRHAARRRRGWGPSWLPGAHGSGCPCWEGSPKHKCHQPDRAASQPPARHRDSSQVPPQAFSPWVPRGCLCLALQ